MSNINAILANASMQVFDTTNSVLRVNSPIGNIILVGTNANYWSDFVVSTTVTNVPFSANVVFGAYVKNVGSTNNIILNVTPVGGVATNMVLAPGGVFLYWQISEPAAAGILGMTVAANAGSTSAEIMVAF